MNNVQYQKYLVRNFERYSVDNNISMEMGRVEIRIHCGSAILGSFFVPSNCKFLKEWDDNASC